MLEYNDTPLFSVLIANYNNGQYLQEAIDSVLSQTYTNWEIIIVDDKSTDNSFEIYKKYDSDSRFHIFYNDENKGCGYTKRRCAEHANGELCGFLDADDVLLPEALLLMVGVHYHNPEVSIVYSRCYFCDENYNIVGENKLLVLNDGETYFDYRWYGALNFASYKKEYYLKTEGISPRIKAGVDQDLYFKVEEVGKPYVLNEFTYKYVVGKQTSLTSIKNYSKLMYWNLEVRRSACLRRGLDYLTILEKEYMDGIDSCVSARMSVQRRELIEEIYNSKTYKVGKYITSPFVFIFDKLKGLYEKKLND